MRPVFRGEAPQPYAKYQDAAKDLKERLGPYCSYCERRLPASLAVEHVVPKSLDPALETSWDNFLLGCTNCNSTKGHKPTDNEAFLWPDRDNTLRVLTYSKGGFVSTAEGLPDGILEKTRRLIDIIGLDRHAADGYPKPSPQDDRWAEREEKWATAERARDLLIQLGDTPAVQELVVMLARDAGCFSVWMTVFSDHVAIRLQLIKAFLGTAPECFDAEGSIIARPSGRV